MGKQIESFSNRLKEALLYRDMKQSELCQLTNTPKSSMSQYLSGRNMPRTDRIYLFSEVLRVSPTWLLGFDVPIDEKINIKKDDKNVYSAKIDDILFTASQYENLESLVRLDDLAKKILELEQEENNLNKKG